jgi:hypothetical protein
MRFARSSYLALASSLSVVAACTTDRPVAPTATAALDERRVPAGFITAQPAQAEATLPQVTIKPIISSGDLMPGSDLPWAPTPDGLGAYAEGGSLWLFANHELTASGVKSTNGGAPFSFSRVSKLQIDPRTLSVISGLYVEDGRSQLVRLCSATFVDINENFPNGLFLTGEESSPTVSGSVVSAFDKAGNRTALPHLGSFSHENQISVPGFGRKIVSMGFDDTAGASELYMYVADDQAAFLAGTGKLYVFRTSVKSAAGNALHSGNLVDGQTVAGEFAEVTDPADLGSAPAVRFANLQKKVDALGAMPFVRIEDGDYAKNGDDEGDDDDDAAPAIYFVDTGNSAVTGRTQVGASCGGTCDEAGSLYRLEFDRNDPTKNARLTLVLRSKGAATGWASPDNIAVTRKSLMLMEDPAYAGFDGSRAPAIWNLRFRNGGKAVAATAKVAQATQETLIPGPNGKCVDATALCWETSGIISTEKWLGRGTWLFVVQAHTLPFSVTKGGVTSNYPNEGGQLLFMKFPGS